MDETNKDKVIDFLVAALSTAESNTTRFLSLIEQAQKIMNGEANWEMQHRLQKINERRNG